LPDFDDVLSDQVAISQVMADTIRALPNAWAVAYDLGKHPQEAAEIMDLPEGQQRRRILDKSMKLRLKPFGVEEDTLPFRAYRAVRDRR
jgi:hypothetical protein